ncbi:hypothetical protein DFO70_1504 [Cytobacillus firmus]|uniref:Uncharacterized protein n=2 Tax=Cytobacillus TaxID=2675230 RepID=A0A366JDJ7_CYTFI|nr:hypothetical protein DFO70_1504 [Cytobacillus firmus]TDX43810.1 hypothetical protein DFO72_10410 [Cytobacillus oceanisediminis]
MRENIKEFMFNSKKYRVIKMIIFFIFLVIVNISRLYVDKYLLYLFFISVLIVLSFVMLLKLFWYERKKNVRTSVMDWILTISIVVLLVYILFEYLQL